jgi:ADP-ribose pyrophosphatase
MNIFNQKEFEGLCNRFNTTQCIEDITIRYTNSSFFNKIKATVQRDRRGEVVFCVCRPDGKVIIITCKDYPQGIYRIPTGGIGHGEDIINAVYREVKEELGLEVAVKRFGGVLRIRFEHNDDYVMFYSYLFILDEKKGRLLLDASDDEISEVKEVYPSELYFYINKLNNIVGKWSDWGKFRFTTSNAILKLLESKL